MRERVATVDIYRKILGIYRWVVKLDVQIGKQQYIGTNIDDDKCFPLTIYNCILRG
jgi:hypothetical protein